MYHACTMKIFFLLSAFLFSYFAPTYAALSRDPNTGYLICQPALNPNLCQLQTNAYWRESYKVGGNWYNVQMNVFDPWCKHIGDAWGNSYQNVSVDSELPWTVEVDLPRYWNTPNFYFKGWYASHKLYETSYTVVDDWNRPWNFPYPPLSSTSIIMFFLHSIAPGRRIRTCNTFQCTTLLVLSTFFTATSAYPIDDLSGQILCLPAGNLPICEVRVTAYGHLSFSYNGASDNVLIDVYDRWCNHIGDAEAHTGQHVSVTSELPWTIELNLPGEWKDNTSLNGAYSKYSIGQSRACVQYDDYYHFTSCIYLFQC